MPITAIARFDFSGTLSITDNTTVSRSLTVNDFGLWGRITDIYVTLNGLTHTFPGDLDFLLVAVLLDEQPDAIHGLPRLGRLGAAAKFNPARQAG